MSAHITQREDVLHMKILRTSAVLAAAGMVGLVFSAAAPAGASTARPAALASLANPLANSQSVGQAGYEIRPAPASSSASASFKVPTVTGCTSTFTAVAPGSFIFTGTASAPSISGATVLVACNAGAPLYQATAIVNRTATPLTVTVAAGDVITTSVTVTKTKVTVVFADTTKHFTKTVTGTGAVPAVVLDGIDTLVQGTTPLPVPKFSPISFSKGKEDGKTPKAAGAIAVDLVTATTPKVIRVLTSALGTTGDSWTETFKHA
jgi:hypothetical protein